MFNSSEFDYEIKEDTPLRRYNIDVEPETDTYKINSEDIQQIKYDVLDKGFVKLISNMGTPFTPVERQRVSYGKGLKSFTDDYKLLTFLQKNKHMTPFEHIYLTYNLKVPIFVLRHLVKYRLSTINELSGRYTDKGKNEFYEPEDIRFEKRTRVIEHEKMTDDELDEKLNDIYNIIFETYDIISENYQKLRDYGVVRELQRIIQPVGQYSEINWTFNLRELFHIFDQRLDEHTQYETRETVLAIFESFHDLYPLLGNLYIEKICENKQIKNDLSLIYI